MARSRSSFLVPCRTCRAQVSDEAKTCPNCGTPKPGEDPELTLYRSISLAIVGVCIVWILLGFVLNV